MTFGIGTYALGLLAGLLSTLSPCVLPLLPILVLTALSRHRLGSLALAAGLSLSFTAIGLWLATLGAALGLGSDTFRTPAAGLMIVFGLVLLSARLQALLTRATAWFAATGQRGLARIQGDGLLGQFAIGLLLGLVWSPCVGPTLGAATTLAAQGRDLAQIALLMGCFGLGAGLPLLLIGALSRATLGRLKGTLGAAGKFGKLLLGVVFLLLGGLLLSGLDRSLEAWLLAVTPAWVTTLSTRF